MKYKNSTFVIPPGYRLLSPGSKIVKGDKFVCAYTDDNDWCNCRSSVGTIYNELNRDNIRPSTYIVITARPIKKRKVKVNNNNHNNNIDNSVIITLVVRFG